jgi:hypothetical protein
VAFVHTRLVARETVELLDESLLGGRRRCLVQPVSLVGLVWNGLFAGCGLWCVGMLLGPEITRVVGVLLWSGICSGSIPLVFLLFGLVGVVGRMGGLSGLVFENCIVDASIFFGVLDNLTVLVLCCVCGG